MIMERHVPKGGAVICGKYFPDGCVVGIYPWVVDQDETIYRPDMDAFHPE
jgi:hypothetical protein